MGLNNYYRSGLETPGYSKHKLLGVYVGSDITVVEARNKLQTEVTAALTSAAVKSDPFTTIRIWNDGSAQTVDHKNRGDADADFDTIMKDDLVIVAAMLDNKAGKVVTQKAGTLVVTPTVEEKSSGHGPAVGLGLIGAIGLLALMSKH